MTQVLVILLLILLNGFFAAAEIAIISMKRSKTKELVQRNDKRGKIIAEFQSHPENFLATIQVGITFVSTFASAFGGASLVEEITPWIQKIPIQFINNYAAGIALGLVVILISYFSIVLGELIPKSIALYYTDKIALFVSYPIKLFSKIAYLFTKFLTLSTNLFLFPLKKLTNFTEAKMTEEELLYHIAEGEKSGAIEDREHEIIENLLSFGDREIGKIMIPPAKFEALDIEETPEELFKNILKSSYSRLPVYKDQFDNIIGILHVRNALKNMHGQETLNIEKLLRPVVFIPTTQRLPAALQKLRKANTHMAIIVDEHGGVAGLVTLEDILEELVGDIKDEKDQPSMNILKISPNHFLVDGSSLITDLNKELEIAIPEDGNYNSLSGFILNLLERFPKKDEVILYENLKFIIKEKGLKTINKVEIQITPKEE